MDLLFRPGQEDESLVHRQDLVEGQAARPLAADLFSDLDQRIALHFIQTYPTPQQAKQLTKVQFAAFCRAHRYYRSDLITRRYGQLLNVQTFASAHVAAAYAYQAQTLARVTFGLIQERDQAQKQLSQAFARHPDRFISEPLPGAGEFLAPALLSRFHDCRARFPTAAVAQAVAGTSPVTIQSGKMRRVQFRRACDKNFRYYATQFTKCSVQESAWAAAYFETVHRSEGRALAAIGHALSKHS
jgi:transposase